MLEQSSPSTPWGRRVPMPMSSWTCCTVRIRCENEAQLVRFCCDQITIFFWIRSLSSHWFVVRVNTSPGLSSICLLSSFELLFCQSLKLIDSPMAIGFVSFFLLLNLSLLSHLLFFLFCYRSLNRGSFSCETNFSAYLCSFRYANGFALHYKFLICGCTYNIVWIYFILLNVEIKFI